MYAGIAVRSSITIGLHRRIAYKTDIASADAERKCRVFWTAFILDRFCSLKLGHALLLRDDEIDAPLPTLQPTEGTTETRTHRFGDATQFITGIKLARISGSILELIYCAQALDNQRLVLNMHKVLTDLKEWHAQLPASLQLDKAHTPSYSRRPIASLHLQFNQVRKYGVVHPLHTYHDWREHADTATP